ncbi:MAG: SDR family oxidoreductase [Lachnospiraceae bacterium]|nr:SDR family oxidoreductase [Lachnospiraceae bacterium]
MKTFALVTGASRGIGRSIAESLAKDGYHLVLTCHKSLEQLTSFAEYLEKEYNITCTARQCDMKNAEAVRLLFEEIPTLDLLINNAGISYVGLLQDMTPEEWDEVMSTNLSSVFYTSKYAIPLMLQKGAGHIINISSVWGNIGASTETAYSASKGGLNAFTKALAKELAPSGIQVNAIACGLIDTQMNSHLSEDDLTALTEEIPAGRMGTPEEVGAAVISLLHMPSYLTGQIITLDGGWT